MTNAVTRGLAAAIAGAFRMPRGVSSMHHTAGFEPSEAIAAVTVSAASTLGRSTASAPAAAAAARSSRLHGVRSAFTRTTISRRP